MGGVFGENALQMATAMMVNAGLFSLKQLALVRMSILGVLGLGTWLFYQLFLWIGTAWFEYTLSAWYTIGAAFLTTCWMLGRLVGGFDLRSSLYFFYIALKSVLLDFFNKEGLILNICFVLLPLVGPLWLLYRYELSAWWGLLLFPLGLCCGLLFYSRLERE